MVRWEHVHLLFYISYSQTWKLWSIVLSLQLGLSRFFISTIPSDDCASASYWIRKSLLTWKQIHILHLFQMVWENHNACDSCQLCHFGDVQTVCWHKYLQQKVFSIEGKYVNNFYRSYQQNSDCWWNNLHLLYGRNDD